MLRILIFQTTRQLCATVIIKKNGDVLNGTIKGETVDFIHFESLYVKIDINKNEIQKLVLDEKSILLQYINNNGKQIKARLIDENIREKIYNSDNGQIIKIKAPVAESVVKNTSNRFIFMGVIGASYLPSAVIPPPGSMTHLSWGAGWAVPSFGISTGYERILTEKIVVRADASFGHAVTQNKYDNGPNDITSRLIMNQFQLGISLGYSIIGSNKLSSFISSDLKVEAGATFSFANYHTDFSGAARVNNSGINGQILAPYLSGGWTTYLKLSDAVSLSIDLNGQMIFYKTLPASPGPNADQQIKLYYDLSIAEFVYPVMLNISAGIALRF